MSGNVHKVVVLAAGEGTRMHPLTRTRPKAMLPIANKPLLEHLLLELRKAGFLEFLFVVGYCDEIVRNHFENGAKWGVHIDYVTQGKQLGTAHAVQTIEGLVSDSFLLVNGDVLVEAGDIGKLADREPPVMGIWEAGETADAGVVVLEGERIARILEKLPNPPSRLVNSGLYILDRGIFEAISRTGKSPRGELELTDSLQLLINEGVPVSYQKLGRWLHVSYPWDLLAANETLLKTAPAENLGAIESGTTIKGTVAIGKNTIVRAGTYIIGPVVIGDNCDIGPNCYIRPSTAIGDNCHIGAAVEVKNSIIMPGTKIPHLNYVGDSVIGENCNLGAGTKIANLRLDKKEVVVGGIKTGRQKLGAIIGDGVETGINASINVGSLIGDHTFIGPGALASGVLPPGSRVGKDN
ncbi:MAG: NTP transferase domain-containing protein [Chloroflexi bacterium]|nr:NTP transferase domain-containing protein [Chloroflexota bacterium]